jgi:hypothetical protein
MPSKLVSVCRYSFEAARALTEFYMAGSVETLDGNLVASGVDFISVDSKNTAFKTINGFLVESLLSK